MRRRDRLILSKDATIREIHHRVKNNLQTISSLLRLQARRLTHPEAVAAVGESVRRIRTIALVHEALSRTGDDVTFLKLSGRWFGWQKKVCSHLIARCGFRSSVMVGEFRSDRNTVVGGAY